MKHLQSANRLSSEVIEKIYLLIDLSGSMDEEDYTPSRKEGALQAALKFIDTKANLYPKDQVGIVGFAERAFRIPCHKKFDGDLEAFRQLINQKGREYDIGACTDFTFALMEARRGFPSWLGPIDKKAISAAINYIQSIFIEESGGNKDKEEAKAAGREVNKRIIMLTDGHHLGYIDPVYIAKDLKESGVTIECIGIAGNRRDVDEELLKKIASTDEKGKPRYYFIKDTSSLIKKYASMAHRIRTVKN